MFQNIGGDGLTGGGDPGHFPFYESSSLDDSCVLPLPRVRLRTSFAREAKSGGKWPLVYNSSINARAFMSPLIAATAAILNLSSAVGHVF